MKKVLALLSIAAIGFAAFSGCKKSSSGAAMSAKINGASFAVSAAFASINNNDSLDIKGGDFSSYTIPAYPLISFLNVPGSIGTYNIDTTIRAFLDSTAASGHYAASSGTITITTSNSTTVTGTFNFTCVGGIAVTNGTFTAAVEP